MLLGDSTLDNGRYLNLSFGELSVEKQLSKRCAGQGWDMTVLAQDGSMLDDVIVRQLPYIPQQATHLVLSASGNDLLALLNQMVVANFTLSSIYKAVGAGLQQVAERYRGLLQQLSALGCHLACCTVYRPNFNHLFFKSLASFGLGLHNARIQQITMDLDCSVIDLANLFDSPEDFANPLELSTRGGAKLVNNITRFVEDHPAHSLQRYRRGSSIVQVETDLDMDVVSLFGLPIRCCTSRSQRRKVYATKEASEELSRSDPANAGGFLADPMEFSQAQQRWREA